MRIPNRLKALVGTKVKLKGHVFSYEEEFMTWAEFDCLGVKAGIAKMPTPGKGKVLGRSYKLLLKLEGMKKAQWTKPIPLDLYPGG